MNDLAGYRIRKLNFIQDRHPDHMFAYLADGELVGLSPYDNGEWGVRRDNGLGGCYACKTKEAAIILCNDLNEQAVMRWLEETK